MASRLALESPRLLLSNQVILVSAIANAHILEGYVSTSYTMVKHVAFRDHYVITSAVTSGRLTRG
jgi:tetraacyldisaccharide-1-P 4'-kinase